MASQRVNHTVKQIHKKFDIRKPTEPQQDAKRKFVFLGWTKPAIEPAIEMLEGQWHLKGGSGQL